METKEAEVPSKTQGCLWLGLRRHRPLEGHSLMDTSDPRGPMSILLERKKGIHEGVLPEVTLKLETLL